MNFPFELKQQARTDVVGFGTNAMDFLIRVPRYPDFNSKIELIDYVQAAGGEIATTMVGLSRLGIRTSYVGRFGSDAAGEAGMDSLRSEGVDLTHADRINGARTQIAFIIIDETSGERTVIWKRDEKLRYTAEDVPLESVASAKILHLTPHDTDACIRLAKEARGNGCVVSIDIDNVFDRVEELLENVDLIIASSEFPAKLLGAGDRREQLVELQRRFGAAVVGVTLGEEGSLIFSDGSFIPTDGFAVPGGCKDTTGAGDSFRVGLLYGLLKGESIEESARLANAVAALKCRAVGARTSLPDAAELEVFINEFD